MIVVDSSVWVDFFNGIETKETDRLQSLLGVEPIIIGDLILAEVLQGFRLDRDYRRALELFQDFPVVGMVGPEMAVQSARNYRSMRKRGITIRKTIDVMIATYCIYHSLALLYSDLDFRPFAEYLGLIEAM